MRTGTRLVIATATLAATTGVSFAQLEEIVVTAQRREQALQTVPVAVSAFRADQVEKLQINVVKDIGDNVPNLQTYTVTAGAQAIQVHARGASVQNPGFIISESPVGIYEDDIYRGRLASVNLDLADVERIEVLRGPQATLYGRNTIAGAIKIVTRTPGDEAWANASIGYGNYQTLKLAGSVGGPIEEGSLAGSISMLYHDRGDGWQPNPALGTDVGQYRDKAVRTKLHWYGTENFNAVLTGWAVDVQNDGYNGVPYTPFFQGPNPRPAGGEPIGGFYDNYSPEGANYGDSDQAGFSLDWSYNLGAATLRSITGFARVNDRFGFDIAGGGFNYPALELGTPALLIQSDSSMDAWSQELQLLGNAFADRLEWIVGGFFLNEDGNQRFSNDTSLDLTNFIGFVLPFDFTERSNSNTDSYAAFADGTWRFSDQWSVTGGLRWTRDKKSYSNRCTGSRCVFDDPEATSVSLNKSFSEVTGRLSVNYQANDDLLLYGSWSQGFQAGGFRTLCFGNLTSQCGGGFFDPQTVDSFELGLKSDLLDRKLRVNAVAFYALYDDIQQIAIRDAGGAASFPINNIGEVDVYGVELEVTWSPTDALNLFAILGYQESSFGKVDPASPPGGQDGTAPPTRDLPSNPKYSGKLGFDYTIPLNTGVNFFYGADLFHTAKYFSEARNLVELSSYTRVNAFVGISEPDGRWQLALTGRNIFDSKDNVSGIYAPFTTNIRTVLPPAEYMLTLKVNY